MHRRNRNGQGATLFFVGFAAGAALMVGVQAWLNSQVDADLRHYREVRDFVTANFVRGADHDELVNNALKGMVGELDTYSRYYDEVEAREVERETRGRFVGIGAVFRGDISSGQILFPLAGSPAKQAGMQVGDRIVNIDGVPIEGFDRADMQAALQGELDSVVELDVIGLDGRERDYKIRRKSVIDPNVRHARIIDAEHGVGYLAILGFSHETSVEFSTAFAGLQEQGMRALIIDLRGNPGGVLSASIEIARRFIPEGLIVSTEGRGAPSYYRAEADQAWYRDFPLAVLTDQGSASASEVLAAALQDHRRAVLVGAPTYGKGKVQTIRRYPEQGTIAKVTTSYYYTPSHRNLQRDPNNGRDYGIAPDLEIPISRKEREAIALHSRHYSPPLEFLEQLRAWEVQEGEELLDRHPLDAQLDAALELLIGAREQPVTDRDD